MSSKQLYGFIAQQEERGVPVTPELRQHAKEVYRHEQWERRPFHKIRLKIAKFREAML